MHTCVNATCCHSCCHCCFQILQRQQEQEQKQLQQHLRQQEQKRLGVAKQFHRMYVLHRAVAAWHQTAAMAAALNKLHPAVSGAVQSLPAGSGQGAGSIGANCTAGVDAAVQLKAQQLLQRLAGKQRKQHEVHQAAAGGEVSTADSLQLMQSVLEKHQNQDQQRPWCIPAQNNAQLEMSARVCSSPLAVELPGSEQSIPATTEQTVVIPCAEDAELLLQCLAALHTQAPATAAPAAGVAAEPAQHTGKISSGLLAEPNEPLIAAVKPAVTTETTAATAHAQPLPCNCAVSAEDPAELGGVMGAEASMNLLHLVNAAAAPAAAGMDSKGLQLEGSNVRPAYAASSTQQEATQGAQAAGDQHQFASTSEQGQQQEHQEQQPTEAGAHCEPALQQQQQQHGAIDGASAQQLPHLVAAASKEQDTPRPEGQPSQQEKRQKGNPDKQQQQQQQPVVSKPDRHQLQQHLRQLLAAQQRRQREEQMLEQRMRLELAAQQSSLAALHYKLVLVRRLGLQPWREVVALRHQQEQAAATWRSVGLTKAAVLVWKQLLQHR